MYEYEVRGIMTGEVFLIHGYSFEDACARCGVRPEDVYVIQFEYVD